MARTSTMSEYFARRLRDEHEPTSEADAEIEALMNKLMDIEWKPRVDRFDTGTA